MPVEYRPDHVARGLANLPSRYADAEDLRALLSIYLGTVQELENVLYDLIVQRQLSTAQGAQLDQYGELVGQERCGLSDDDYRGFIRARIRANRASGRIPEIQFVFQTQMQADSVLYLPTYPAAYTLQANNPQVADECKQLAAQTMQELAPSGVRVDVVDAPAGAFGFADDPDALGFDAGVWAEEIL